VTAKRDGTAARLKVSLGLVWSGPFVLINTRGQDLRCISEYLLDGEVIGRSRQLDAAPRNRGRCRTSTR
jgi:hypothetical protein